MRDVNSGKAAYVSARLTNAQRRTLEAVAAAKRTTLTGAICVLLENAVGNRGIMLMQKSSEASAVREDLGTGLTN